MDKIKVILADDHQIVLDGLSVVLQQHDDLEVLAQLSNGNEVLAYLENKEADIVILDINMPEMDGLSCAKQLKKLYPKLKIIILTMYGQKSFTEQIVKLGIDGCLLKNNSGKELYEAIKRVMNGKFYYDLIKEFDEENEEIIAYKLSNREIEVIKLLAQGRSTAQIAEQLFISEHTVSTHRKNILKKTEASNTSQLIQFAHDNQLI